MKNFISAIITLCLIPLLALYFAFSWGYVATVIYSWFILPLFPTFPIFTPLQFAGIMYFVNCFVHTSNVDLKEEYKDNTSSFISRILNPWILLFGAFVIHQF